MRMLFGLAALLIVVAIVGNIAAKQLRATSQATGRALPPAEGGAAPVTGNVREQAQALGRNVQGQVGQALQQSATARGEESQK